MPNEDKKAAFFGFGVALCLILAALLFYGMFMGTADANTAGTAQTQTEPALERPFDMALQAKADFIDVRGQQAGQALLEERSNGVFISLQLRNMPPGEHAIHIHETGRCAPVSNADAEDTQGFFSDAGSHLNPESRAHGFMIENGPHAGDLPNIFVDHNGEARAHAFNDLITLRTDANISLARIFDEDGAAIIVHEGADDYSSQPTGEAGSRIACAEIVPEGNMLQD